MQPITYFWDENRVRYRLAAANGGVNYNWLFFPGGPGADSCYLMSLIDGLQLSGNVWLIDLPNNGSNEQQDYQGYDFDRWYDCFLPVISRFSNPIYVGHSFGGMFPLLFPQLEMLLSGFVVLSSTPSLWLDEAARMAYEKNIPILQEPLDQFQKNPNPETFKTALNACMPYYFPPHSLERGAAVMEGVPLNFYAAGWWLNKVNEVGFNAKWIPQEVPTLILNGMEDCITPYTLFENDLRFHRDNITRMKIENAGHLPWVEQMDKVKQAFTTFEKSCVRQPSLV